MNLCLKVTHYLHINLVAFWNLRLGYVAPRLFPTWTLNDIFNEIIEIKPMWWVNLSMIILTHDLQCMNELIFSKYVVGQLKYDNK